ncbi:hypothetical protein ACIPY6_07260 [Streptomyces sp. NPDC090054]|uniref:hypothetical protein n=1 Tax=Streptomyces sp. NPDC090054 TaxID=3365933 RepID=UPI00380BF445
MKIPPGLGALSAALASHSVVNLCGPLGSGKSTLARWLPVVARVDLCGLPASVAAERVRGLLARAPEGDGVLLVDSLDGPGQAEAVTAVLAEPRPSDAPEASGLLGAMGAMGAMGVMGSSGRRSRAPGAPSVLVVSRRPLRGLSGWADRHSPSVVPLKPWPAEDIEDLVRAAGLEDEEAVALAVRLAGGYPLPAALAAREFLAGTPADAPGAVADAVTEEVLGRLDRERPRSGGRDRHALRLLATVGAGDERLLTAGPEVFSALAALSLVRRGPLGLAVREPYRSLFELAYAWRRPQAHHDVRTRAAGYRQTSLTERRDPRERARIVEQGLFLSGEPALRRSLFPPVEDDALIRPARSGDADDIGRLMRRWAVRNGFDPRRSERVTEGWLASAPAAFHLARDRDGAPVALAALVPVGPDTADGIEPLLQQHAPDLLAPRPATDGDAGPGGPDGESGDGGGAGAGLFLGAAYGADTGAHAQMLRHILVQATLAGHLLVSTASPDYQSLLHALSFRRHGGIRDDVYRCGRRPEVYSQEFTATGLAGWIRRLGAGPAAAGTLLPTGASPAALMGQDLPALVGRALAGLRDPGGLAGNPLLALPELSSLPRLRAWLTDRVAALAACPASTDREAGTILVAYYLGRSRTHQQIARALHLSRATYFRRLRRGLILLATQLPSSQPPPIGHR